MHERLVTKNAPGLANHVYVKYSPEECRSRRGILPRKKKRSMQVVYLRLTKARRHLSRFHLVQMVLC